MAELDDLLNSLPARQRNLDDMLNELPAVSRQADVPTPQAYDLGADQSGEQGTVSKFFSNAVQDLQNIGQRYVTGVKQAYDEAVRANEDFNANAGNSFEDYASARYRSNAAQGQLAKDALETPAVTAALAGLPYAGAVAAPFVYSSLANAAQERAQTEGVSGAVKQAAGDITGIGPLLDELPKVTTPDYWQQVYDEPITTLGNTAMAFAPAVLGGKYAYKKGRETLDASLERQLDELDFANSSDTSNSSSGQNHASANSSFESLVNAISGQESGGNYDAVNGRTGAAGKFQIMPENWPEWAEQAGIGRDAPMAPENQEIVARNKLREYYDKYGPRGAAEAWYGGEGAVSWSEEAKNRRQGNGDEPSVNEYADSVLSRMGDQGNGGPVRPSGIAPDALSQSDYDLTELPEYNDLMGVLGKIKQQKWDDAELNMNSKNPFDRTNVKSPDKSNYQGSGQGVMLGDEQPQKTPQIILPGRSEPNSTGLAALDDIRSKIARDAQEGQTRFDFLYKMAEAARAGDYRMASRWAEAAEYPDLAAQYRNMWWHSQGYKDNIADAANEKTRSDVIAERSQEIRNVAPFPKNQVGAGEHQNDHQFMVKPQNKVPDVLQNIERGQEAMRQVIEQQKNVLNAMERPDLGSISFYWGEPGRGKKYKGGYGVSHIIARRMADGDDGIATVKKMVDVIAKGEVSGIQEATNGSRALISYDGHTAVLSLYKEGNRHTWLLTGWKDKKEASNAASEVYDSTSATSSKPTRFQSGRAETSFTNDNIQQSSKIFNNAKQFRSNIEPMPDSIPRGNPRPTPSDNESSLSEVSRKQVLDTVKDMFTTVRTGRLGVPGVLGWRNKITGMIRTGKYADFPTIMHEIGHYLDEKYGLRRVASAFDKEFTSYIKREFGNAYDDIGKNGIHGEAIAEFIQEYTIDRKTAQKDFPQFYKHFEQFLKNAPELQEQLQKISGMLHTWYHQSPEARVKGSISFGDDRHFLQKASDALRNPTDTAKSIVEKGKELFDAGYDKLVDQLAPLDRMMKQIEQITGQKLPDAMNVFKQAWLTRGWMGKAQTLIERGIPEKGIPALQSIVKMVEKDIKGFSSYVTALREVDAYNLEAKGTDKFEHAISNLDAARTVAKYRQNPEFVKAQQDLVKYNNHLLDMLVDAGLKDRASVEAMKERWPNYVPFFREFSDAAVEKFFSTKGFGNIGDPIKAFKGSAKDIINPLESIIKNTYHFMNLAERNKVGRLFVDLARKPGLGDLIEKVSGSANSKDSTFAVWENGKKQVYTTEPALYRAIMLLDREPASGIAKILQMPAGWLRAGATLTPEFIARNPIRDAWDAFIYSKYGFIPGVDTFKGLMHFLKKDDLYWEYMNSGAAHSALVSLDRDYLAQNLRELMGKSKIEKMVAPFNPKTYLNILRAFSEATEVATRLGEYENARKGYSGIVNRLFSDKRTPQTVEQAALGSRDITLDFSRSGVFGKEANKYIAFWNAAIQGTDKMAREFKQNPVRTSSKVFLAITLPSIVLYYMNRDDQRYQELPQWQKDLFWIIPTKDTLIRIPKPFELGILFGTSVERMLQWMDKKDSSAFKGLGKTAFESMMPGWMPTALLPIVEWYSNYSFFMDRNIVSQSQLKLPPAMQYGPNTSNLGKWIGSAINKSPAKVDNTIRDLTGGLGGLAMTATDLASGAFNNKPSLKLSEYPGIRAFTATPYKSSQSVQDFYDTMNEQEQFYNQWRQTGQRPTEFNSAQYQRLKAVDQIMTQLNKQEKAILNNQSMSSEEKRNRLDRLQIMEVNYARIGLGRQKVAQ